MPGIAIHSRRMQLPDGERDATLWVEGGRIVRIAEGVVREEGMAWLDIGDKVLMAGVIDPHVHINEPGRTEWEGFATAGMAAAAGGITTLVEMPLNASPVTTTAVAWDLKMMAAVGRLRCDIGFWGGLVPGNHAEIESLIEKGVLGFKAFLTHSGIDEFPNVREADLRAAMPLIAKYRLPLLVHCEMEKEGGADAAVAEVGLKGGPDRRSYRRWLESRPREWENRAIALMIRLCEEYGCRTHIVHLSSSDAIPMIAEAKRRGLPLTVETAQHYLYFAAEDIADGEPVFKCAPPIRERANRELLWSALQEGIIDMVATDHSPAPPDMKHLDSGDLASAWGGIASLQLALPALWTPARARGSRLDAVSRWLCEAPSKLAGQEHCRGRLAPGYRADLVVWDPDRRFRVEGTRLFHRHAHTPYEGQELYGVVEQTWLAGQKIFDGGKMEDGCRGRIIVNEIHGQTGEG